MTYITNNGEKSELKTLTDQERYWKVRPGKDRIIAERYENR